MEATPRSAKVLSAALESHGWQQSDLADKAGIARPTVSHHLTGARVIRDDHLVAYCDALDRYERPILVAAWLRDTLSEPAQADVLDPHSSKLNEAARTWSAKLTDEQKDQLDFWASILSTDTEIADVFSTITRRAGWQPKPKDEEPAPVPGASIYAAIKKVGRQIDATSGGTPVKKNAGER